MLSKKLAILDLVSKETGIFASHIVRKLGNIGTAQRWYGYLQELRTDGYIKFDPNGDWPQCGTRLTPMGEEELESTKKLSRAKRIEWIRYIITTVIAVAALVIAGISILLQLAT